MFSSPDTPYIMDTLFLAWQDPGRRRWYTVGKLDFNRGEYNFVYTKGAIDAQAVGFNALVSFPNLEIQYRSRNIFPLFANRVLPENRPEYREYIEWLSLTEDNADPTAILARAGGGSQTDTLEIFPYPTQVGDNKFRVHFFVRGVRHQASCSQERVKHLEVEEKLLLMPDVQNPYDEKAVMLRTSEKEKNDMHLLGYLPRYLANELYELKWVQLNHAEVRVVRINPPPAPIHFRVLCSLTMNWPQNRKPFSDEQFLPML